MTIKEFIEKAIEGGWDYKPVLMDVMIYDSLGGEFPIERVVRLISGDAFSSRIFLDTKAWKAVFGEAIEMSMYDILYENGRYGYKVLNRPIWYWNMQRMITEMANGKTLESHLATLG